MNQQYEQYQHLRDALERDTNKSVIPAFHPKVFQKTNEERKVLKSSKIAHSVLKENKVRFNDTRNELLNVIADYAKRQLKDNFSLKITK
jgi:hypothetical protein